MTLAEIFAAMQQQISCGRQFAHNPQMVQFCFQALGLLIGLLQNRLNAGAQIPDRENHNRLLKQSL